jgi:hypothetical protein
VEAWPAVARLRFRSKQRPAWERRATGPTVLETHTEGSVPTELAVGDELRIGATTVNVGGPSTGLDIVVFGTALSLVDVERFELLIGSPRTSRHRELAVRDAKGTDDAPLRTCAVPDAAIPAGLAVPAHQLFAGAAQADVMRALEARMAAQVHVNVVGRVRVPGEGELHVGFVPHANPEDGQTSSTWALRVSAPPFRPLRATDDAPSHLLRPLTEGRKLFAMVMYAARDEAAAAHAESALREVLALRAAPQLHTVVYHADATLRPKTGKVRALGFFEGKSGRAIRSAIRTENVVEVATDPAGGALRAFAAANPMAASFGGAALPGFGWTYGTTTLRYEQLETIAGLGLWADLEDDTADAFEDTFRRIVDGAMAAGALQAAMGIGGWGPSGGLEHTAYETVCGIEHGVATCTRAWCTRWLRMTGNRATWLGAELSARLEGTAPADVEVVRVGEATRVTIAPGEASWRALEEWLSPLLPTSADAQAISRAYYARLREG